MIHATLLEWERGGGKRKTDREKGGKKEREPGRGGERERRREGRELEKRRKREREIELENERDKVGGNRLKIVTTFPVCKGLQSCKKMKSSFC
jgi:hypothetical protein